MTAIRGAITTLNTRENIFTDSAKLVGEIMRVNNLIESDILAIIFSVTCDLDKAYPAEAVRKVLGLRATAMMCLQEMYVEGSLSNCIRVLVTVNKHIDCPKHVYLNGAKVLRPDFVV